MKLPENSRIAACVFVTFTLAASFYFYKSQKCPIYVENEEDSDMRIPPNVPSSIIENLCKWPMLPDNETDSMSSITQFRNIRCETSMDPYAFLDEYGVLEVSPPIMGKSSLNDTNIKCSYRPLRSRGIDGYVMGDAETIEFNQRKEIHYDQFVVQCHRDSSSLEIIYEKAFVNVPKSKESALENKFLESSWEHPSMALLLFDSVSLNQFKRSMPQTWEFMQDNGFLTMNMHNEMTEDSDANILSVLTGGQEPSLNQTFLWDAMRERQCMTYLSEEIGDFLSVLGKLSLNVEYDLRPFYAYAKKNNDGFCTRDGQAASRVYLENWKKALLNSRENCHFSMHYMRTLTRVNPGYLSLLDEELRQSLESLKANGLFEDTVFALMSSRGSTSRSEDQLLTARVEELSPLFSIKLPEKYLKKYYQQHSNLRENVNRLTTTTDVGLTLMDITLYNPLFSTKNLEQAYKSTSLLRAPVSINRTCDSVSIPSTSCLCMIQNVQKTKRYPSDSLEFKQLFEYIETEVLKEDCIAKVLVSDDYPYLTVLSLNTLVQNYSKKHGDWKNIRDKHKDVEMNYIEITVEAYTVPKTGDRAKRKVVVRMRFRQQEREGFKPVGSPVVLWTSDPCYTKRLDKFCEMCYYSTLLTE